ncbi:MAG: hypothetical protein AAF805_14230 [Planctomycetota bacterium]
MLVRSVPLLVPLMGFAFVAGTAARSAAQTATEVASFQQSKQVEALTGPSTASATNEQILRQLRGQPLNAGGIRATPSNVFGGLTSAPAGFGPPVGGTVTRPFENARLGPTVSPYLQLFNSNLSTPNAAVENYQTLVRPQLQQQRVNQQLQRQQQALNARVQQISAQSAYQPQGSEQMMATGHRTFVGYYSRFYPTLNTRR